MLSKQIIAAARGRGFVAGKNARAALSMTRGWCVICSTYMIQDCAEVFFIIIMVGRSLARIQDGQSSIQRLLFKVTDLRYSRLGKGLLKPHILNS
jgi:hypothetical protein